MRGLLIPFPLLLVVKKELNYSLLGKVGLSYNERLIRKELTADRVKKTHFTELSQFVGIPLEIELREEITSFFGLGVSVFANINAKLCYSGFNLNLYAGQF